MVFYVRGLNTWLREKYGERLNSIEGAIGILEEIAGEEKFFWDDNFNVIYNSVLRHVNQEESLTKISDYRKRLDEVDEKLGKIFRERRGGIMPREKKRMLKLSMAGVE